MWPCIATSRKLTQYSCLPCVTSGRPATPEHDFGLSEFGHMQPFAEGRCPALSVGSLTRAKLMGTGARSFPWPERPEKGSVLNSVCEAGVRLFHGGGRRLRRTTDAVGKSVVKHLTLVAA